ncbi:MAG: hypothetical protein RID91_01170 [Azospirillaceae bacterium]
MTDETLPRRGSRGAAMRRMAAVLALAALPLAPAAAQEAGDGAAPDGAQGAPPEEFSIATDGWQGGAIGNRDGSFSHCVAQRDMAEGFRVLFQAGPNFEVNLVLASEGFTLEPRTEAEATVVVDGAFSRTYPAMAAQESVLVVATGRDPELVERVMRGANAVVSGPHGEVTIPLDGTFSAFTALETCVQKARELIQAGEIPAPGQGGGNGEQGAGGQGDGRMTARGIDELLRQAGIEDAAIADPSSIPDDPLDLGQVWQIDEALVGGLHQTARGEAESMAAFMSDFLGLLEERCPGEATVERGAVERLEGGYAFADASVTCRAENGSAHVALFFALDDNYYSAFFHETSAEQAPRAEEATGKLAAFVRDIARQSVAAAAQDGGDDGDGSGVSITGAAEATSGIEENGDGDAAPASDAEDEAGSDSETGTEDSPAQ